MAERHPDAHRGSAGSLRALVSAFCACLVLASVLAREADAAAPLQQGLPLPPTGLTATDGTSTSKVDVTWNASAGATGYEVWRHTTNNAAAAARIAASVVGRSYEDSAASPGVTYWYWATAKNATGTSGFSGGDCGLRSWPTPAPPTGLAASDAPLTTAVHVTWNPSAGATSYEVWRDTSDDPASATRVATLPGTSFADSAALTTPCATFWYWVKAKNGSGTSGFSAGDSGSCRPEPSPPTGFAASDGTSLNEVHVAWDPSAGAESYEVWRHTSNDLTAAACIAADVASTHYDDATAARGAVYWYWAKAKNSACTSGFSGGDPGHRAWPTPPAPTGLAATDDASTLALIWDPSPGATSYQVWRHTANAPGAATRIADSVEGTAYEDAMAAPDTAYWYWVTASNATGTSGLSNSDSGYREPPTLQPPAELTASDATSAEEIAVQWNASVGATSYEVWRHTSDDLDAATRIASSVAGTSYADGTAEQGRTYWYWTKAKNASEASWFSNGDSGRRRWPPDPPAGVRATDAVSSIKVDVFYSAARRATSYEVWRHTSDDPAAATCIDPSVTGTWYKDFEATPEVTYYYWVKSKNDDGTSGFSEGDSGYRRWPTPAPPTGLTATDGSSIGKVLVTWDPAAGAESYELWRHTDNDSGSAACIAPSVAGTSYEDSAATPGTTFWYWVKAKNEDGTSDFSDPDDGYAASGDLIVDNRDAGFTVVSGGWGTSTWAGCYASDYRYHARGRGLSRCRWSVPLAAPGLWEVFAWWKASSSRGSNVPYVVHHSGGPTTVRVDQRTNSSRWNSLGTFAFQAGDGIVEMTDDANGYVIADAVRFVYTAPATAPAAPTGVAATDGTRTDGVLVAWDAVPGATSYEVRRHTSDEPGDAQAVATSVAASSYLDTGAAADVQYWYWVKATSPFGESGLSASDSGSRAFAGDLIIDNRDPGFSVVAGTWGTSTGSGRYGPDYRYHRSGSGSSRCRWTASIPKEGRWAIFAWWRASRYNATNAPYTIHHDSGDDTVRASQKANGGAWNNLGTYTFKTADAVVEVSDDVDGYVLADAVRFVYAGPTQPAAAGARADVRSVVVPERGPAPLEIQAMALGVGPLDTCRWDFGDGAWRKGALVTHTYLSPGTYTVILRAAGKVRQTTVVVDAHPDE